ncbi:uncharacterized protein LOC127849849 isoform X2 [Dreissena polymorpha]|uniref:CUB domain-containing protein n=1 Tax=Dreissena polymorpha TaxID=45954 RepID=A0A9D4S210_DREPO|nr:uncharacterized protein LOC127849849 isoform X2 [Dreissena polymorpha]KAH3889604.1 hypothetical protein DPMN_013663 [Dreissena polymorpha]
MMKMVIRFGFHVFFLFIWIYSALGADATIVKDGDVIQPRFSVLGKYMKLEDQTWELPARSGHWALVCHHMEIENSNQCEHDYLQIKESNPTIPIAKYCGNVCPEPYISETSHLDLQFVSDTMFEFSGFKFSVFHAAQKELLIPKIRSLPNQESFVLRHTGSDAFTDDTENNTPTFYWLVASVGIALLCFAALLIYFAALLRMRNKQAEPTVFYSSSESTSTISASTNNSDSRNDKSKKRLLSSGKRYSRRLADSMASVQNGHVVLGRSDSMPVKFQHNILYEPNA